ncbi:MAG: tRNA pseudouridine(55) synthase TruB [Acidimicrobiales bacterium]
MLDGVVVVDKPSGWTSHDIVAKARQLLGERRVGHAGTLDPAATGVLVLGVGRATRLLRFASDLEKRYVGEVVLGVATSTLDDEGEVVATFDMDGVSLDDARAAAAELTGTIQQVPPMVSALKVDGRRLYALAREGIEIERAPRTVEVRRFEVGATTNDHVFRIEVDCSSGTYVRSLAADLGSALGGGAHLRALRRLAVGHFEVSGSVAPEDVSAAAMRSSSELVAHLPKGTVQNDIADMICNGRVLERRKIGAVGDGPVAVFDENDALLAVYAPVSAERSKPLVVLARGS